MPMPAIILESILLALTCSIDSFTASFAYGSGRIRIPFLSNQIINLICSSILGMSLWLGAAVRGYFPDWLTTVVCFAILFITGLTKLLDGITKSIIRKYYRKNSDGIKKEIRFSLFNFKFILNLYADPEGADINADRTVSPGEAAALAVSLSLDGAAVGFGAALGNADPLAVFLCSLVIGLTALLLGGYLGNTIARKLPFNFSWLSGAMLIALAVIKLF